MNSLPASFTMTTYNHGRFVAEAIRSVFAQSTAVDELVISDDASTDDTWSVIQEEVRSYNGPIKVVTHRHPSSGEVRIIGRGYNLRESCHDPTAHAEIEALRRASRVLGHWRLEECELFVTLEPCVMCSGAIVNSRVKRVVYGCHDPKAGGARSLYRLLEDPRLNHRAELVTGVYAERCAQLLRSFFQERRALKQRLKRGSQNST